MEAASLIIYIFAFGLGCMCLALAIVYQIRKQEPWNKYLITCLSSCLGCMVLLAMQQVVRLSLEKDGLAYRVLSVIINAVVLGNVVFLSSFIPYFTSWITAEPLKGGQRAFFLGISVLDALVGVWGLASGDGRYVTVLEVLFVFVLAVTFALLLHNLPSISEKNVRLMCFTEIIVGAAMLPAIALTLILPAIKGLMCGIYFMAFSITMMVFLFLHFFQEKKREARPKELSMEDVQQWHVTEREFAVVRLIAKGLTNREIAEQLGISTNTVNNHVANIFTKTKVRSRIDLLNLLKQSW